MGAFDGYLHLCNRTSNTSKSTGAIAKDSNWKYPEWAKWIAFTKDGTWLVYNYPPTIGVCSWTQKKSWILAKRDDAKCARVPEEFLNGVKKKAAKKTWKSSLRLI